MRKSTFVGNLVAWAVVAAVCGAFLVWYHMSDMDVVTAAIAESALVQLGVVLAGPGLLYAVGAILGLVLVRLKKIMLGRGFKRTWRAVGLVGLALIAMAGLPMLGSGFFSAFMWATVVVVYVSMMAPILIAILGFLYALGCAGVDATRRGPLADYLPDDHFER